MTTDEYQRLFDIGWIVVLALACICAIALLSGIASATVQISQGDYVYMGETVDVSMAASWPAFQICWCSPSNYDCDPPDQVIDVDTNMENFYVDPAVMKYGYYYRWDGAWHPAEYAVAFKVMQGTRPVIANITNESVMNVTSDNPIIEGPFYYLIARGDSPKVYTVLNRTDTGTLWIFSDTLRSLNLGMSRDGNTYYLNMGDDLTYAIGTGEYDGYIQLNGQNKMQDIFLDRDILDTIYDDRMVADVPLITWNLGKVKEQFDQLRKSFACDDEFVPIKISVHDPDITITDVEQEEMKITLHGVTTWNNRTTITVKLDPDNYATTADIKSHTWQTYPEGTIDQKREFTTALNIERENLWIGSHDIQMNVTKNGMTTSMDYTFKVTDVYVMPTPTPEKVRVLVDENYQPLPTVAKPLPIVTITPVELQTITIGPSPLPPPPIVTTMPTTEPPKVVTSVTTILPTTRNTNVTVPLPAWIAFAALVIVWGRR